MTDLRQMSHPAGRTKISLLVGWIIFAVVVGVLVLLLPSHDAVIENSASSMATQHSVGGSSAPTAHASLIAPGVSKHCVQFSRMGCGIWAVDITGRADHTRIRDVIANRGNCIATDVYELDGTLSDLKFGTTVRLMFWTCNPIELRVVTDSGTLTFTIPQ